jgi:cullin 1
MCCVQIPLHPTDEKEEVIVDVNKNRKLSTEACIVRIMKSRKVMGHEQLILECINQMSRMFKVL